MTLKTDPRADPRMLAALAEFGFDEPPSQPPVTAASPHEEILDFLAAAEHVYENVFKEWFSGLSPIENVERRTEVITGVDDNHIALYVHQPSNPSGRLPCVYHIHGGGMAILQASNHLYTRRRERLQPDRQRDLSQWRHGVPQGHAGGVCSDDSGYQGVRGFTVISDRSNTWVAGAIGTSGPGLACCSANIAQEPPTPVSFVRASGCQDKRGRPVTPIRLSGATGANQDWDLRWFESQLFQQEEQCYSP
jgi:hypothetical protein